VHCAPLPADTNPDRKGCLTGSKLIEESEKHIYCENLLWFLCIVHSMLKLPVTAEQPEDQIHRLRPVLTAWVFPTETTRTLHTNQKVHCKKSFSIFPSPAGMSLTKLSLGGSYDVIYKLFLPREGLVSDTDISAGDRNIEKIFFTVYVTLCASYFLLIFRTSTYSID